MAKRVTVSIPDMLHEKMEKWRESFNLSKMFQDAVMEAIQKKEDFQKRIREDLDLHEIIERLRSEKARSEGNFFDSGRRDGLLWARLAHYDDLRYALDWHDVDNALKDEVLALGQRVADAQGPMVRDTDHVAGIGGIGKLALRGKEELRRRQRHRHLWHHGFR